MKKFLFILFIFSFFIVKTADKVFAVVCNPQVSETSCAGIESGSVCNNIPQTGVCTLYSGSTDSCQCVITCNTQSSVSCAGNLLNDPCTGNPNSICTSVSATDLSTCVCQTTGPVVTPTPTPTPSISSTPTPPLTPVETITPLPPFPSITPSNKSCDKIGKNTVYPPNSECYPKVKLTESAIDKYPLTCIAAPEITYSENFIGPIPPAIITIPLSTDVSEATVGFLGPDMTTLSSATSDQLSKKYLFNGLLDRPIMSGSDLPRESFRTIWRLLSAYDQANLKSAYLLSTRSNGTKNSYYYLDKNGEKKEANTKSLYESLPSCLKKFPVCTTFADAYLKLSGDVLDQYDTLLPYNFNNTREFLVLNGQISRENIPYLNAIVNAVTGDKGLFNFYTPASFLAKKPTKYSTTSDEKSLTSALLKLASNTQCVIPSKASQATSPKTYPSVTNLDQTINIIVSSQFVSSTNDLCTCNSTSCQNLSCDYYTTSNTCESVGCTWQPGETTWKIVGKGKGKFITVFNNPLIKKLTDAVMGGGEDKAPSFFKMLLPSFAKDPDKAQVSAPIATTTSSNGNVTVTNGSSPIYRENYLATDAIKELQDCWLIPGSNQSSTKCKNLEASTSACLISEQPLTGSCSKAGFASYFQGKPMSGFTPNVSAEVSAVYAEAEKQTGVSCVILAGIHFMEGGNDPCKSLVSGRTIGEPEPDQGNKVYKSLLETAIVAGNVLKAKGLNGSYQSLITALSHYNGGGNSNCRGSTAALYGHCPPLFPGEDDPYAISLFDARHQNMYLRCASDGNCSSTIPFNRPGAFAVASNYYLSLP